MKSILTKLIVIVLLLNVGCRTSYVTNAVAESKKLFIAANQDFITVGDARWDFDKDIISGSNGQGYLVTKKSYKNFTLTVEFKPDSTINSGIFIRCPEGEQSAGTCYEINIWDNHTNQDFRTGSIVTHGKPMELLNTINQWNEYKISATENRIQVWLNGTKTADLVDSKSANGNIAIQAYGKGVIQFRNIQIIEI